MRGFDNKALFRTPVSFNKPAMCKICNEDFAGCDRYGCWKLADNSQAKPKYSVVVYLVIGGLITVSMLTGVAVGMWGSR